MQIDHVRVRAQREEKRLELGTNPVKNANRPVWLTRNNALFVSLDVGAKNFALLVPSWPPATSTM
ncbi:hypothetical protein H8A99_05120 [Bradyrhizobium sp. Arg68]|uniref:IS66 family transposase n=1 Tax=Bradyrhizobium ivorense TaxID=2511166 RepID=UPI001E2C0038|nr:IS66 family transposase [Bradyrhizobium ivorense]MCC8935887.1 hypothetical protein [Bradyrhizobium ivorense]